MSLNTKFHPSKSKNAGFISKKRVVGVSYVGATKNWPYDESTYQISSF